MREFYGNDYLDFFYDADGKPFALNYNGTYYYYILNLQGDVIRLIDGNGITVAAYEYDPYGKIIYASGSMASINPLRYRGYYYDNETGLYYLQSRYYDPQTGRFISPDAYASTGQGMLGNNMFAYCLNNPANYFDSSGNAAIMTCRVDEDIRFGGGLGFLGCGGGGGGGGVGYAAAAFSSAVSSMRNESNKLTYQSLEDKNGAKIVDSYKVINPITMYMVVNEYRGDEISGSTTGVVVEWIVHDLAYGAGWVLNECGLTGIGQEWMDKGRILDVGSTIYDDSHGVFSKIMWGVYLFIAPIHSKVDFFIEVFE